MVLLLFWLYSAIRGRLAAGVRNGQAPYGRFVLSVQSVWHVMGDALGDAVSIREQLQALEAENTALKAQLLRQDAWVAEVDAYRAALGLQKVHEGSICAEVVSRGDSAGWWREIRLNKGSRNGIRLNAPVVSADGLVGRIVRVTDETADVLLLTDANSKVACEIEGEGAGARGIVMGGGIHQTQTQIQLLHVVEPFSLSYLDKEETVSKGARVVTSGLGGVYPRGIPVGEVLSSHLDSSRLHQHAVVAPYVDFASLRQVFVLERHVVETASWEGAR